MDNFTLQSPQFQPYSKPAGARDRVSGSARPATLSKAHNCPQTFDRKMKFYIDGSKVVVTRPHYRYQGKHTCGQRGAIKNFSWQSRRRLMYKMAEISVKSKPLFVTLTYPDTFPTDPLIWKSDLTKFFKRLKRKYDHAAMMWKLEPQERGAPHYHLLVWGVPYNELYSFAPQQWYLIAGNNDVKHLKWHYGLLGNGNKHCVSEIDTWRGVMSYTSKYLGKECTDGGWGSPGRFWGIKSRDDIPWAELVTATLCYHEGFKMMRLMRRYAHIHSRAYQSLTIFCNSPNYWYDRFIDIVKTC